jgi:hypothetical protein
VTATTGHIERRWFQHLQALEDAIAYRRARITAPCPDCTASGHRCDDHACDLDLIADYQQTAMAAIRDEPSVGGDDGVTAPEPEPEPEPTLESIEAEFPGWHAFNSVTGKITSRTRGRRG